MLKPTTVPLVELEHAAEFLPRHIGPTAADEAHMLRADPSLANTDPLGNGWFFKVHITDMGEFDQLMDPPAYDKLLKNL